MKWIIMALLLVAAQAHSYAQRGDGSKRERLDALKIAFITEELQLSSEQAQQFWPIYNELEQELRALRKKSRSAGDPSTMADPEAEAWVRQQLDWEAEKVAIKRRYLDRLSTVLDWQQIASLLRVEKRFKEELLKRMRERRRSR